MGKKLYLRGNYRTSGGKLYLEVIVDQTMMAIC